MGLISDIGSQVADIARTQGELNALKAAKEATGETLPANATEKQRQEYLAKLRDTQAYRNEMAKYGTGSEIQRGIQAATAALQGLAGGNLAGALAGASAPELAHLLKSTEKDPAVNAIAHAILGGAAAAMQGNNVAAGAAGAATGELAARAIAGMLYPGVKQSDLSEEQKQTINTLATVSAGLAGGLTGNSTASAAVGAQSGKNAVENNSLAGDKARESVKQSAEWWKTQVRDKLGDGASSAIANGIINVIADSGDTAIGSADYVGDAAMALASCATGESYCDKALSDLAGKNQAVADSVKALMQSETWSAVAENVKQAYGGNQAALEATGGILASLILPGKKIPNAGATIVSDSVAFSAKQLDKKFKHASDFGVITTKKNSDTIAEYQAAIKSHLDNKTTYEHGTYLLIPESKVFFNPQTNNVVVIDKSGNFVSGWKLDPQTKQYENFINNGTLR
ncbi:VENN motif pre-toxin domain-containing protein [Escherichia coli]|nr:VENN motif pre-toxin domain-containing protein [Escherichia coli]EHK7136591.1 VENN motif pre-toxin domain-containing protein [Escherichia coli]EHK7151781.1 VENN motif pre-toxin domain-containing protein [Escherichia coli]